MKKLLLFLFCLSLYPICFAYEEPIVKKPYQENPNSLLMIGNSFMYYNNSMHKPLLNLIRSSGKLGMGHRIRSITINSSSLSWHDLESYINNENIGSFNINSENILKKHESSGYQMVIMQDCSQCPIHPELKNIFHQDVEKHTNFLKKRGIEASLMMTWAYKDKPEMTEKLAREYILSGNKNNLLVIPVGLAFKNSSLEHPNIELYTSDKRHPSREGSYLAACMIFSSIFQISPVGNNYFFDLNKDIALNLQGVAWKTFQDFYSTDK